MAQIQFANANQINAEWLTYLANEAETLASQDDDYIESYVDNEVNNPQVQEFLDNMPEDNTRIDAMTDLAAVAVHASPTFIFKWKRLKEKIRKILCEVLAVIEGQYTWADLIQKVLLALLPVFAGGIPALALPIIVYFVAKLIKRGADIVCPVAA
jgi:hypothetical protein